MMPETQNPTSTLDQSLLTLLQGAEVVTEDQLGSLVERCKGEESVFEKMLLSEGYLIDDQLGRLKAQAHGWRFVDLRQEAVDDTLLSDLPRAFAETNQVIPYRHRQGEPVNVAMADGSQGKIGRLLRKKYGRGSEVCMATPSALAAALAHYDQAYKDRTQAILSFHEKAESSHDSDDASIIQLVDAMIVHALRQRASDIHIEPNRSDVVVRERIDGVLSRTLTFGKEVHELVVTRIKVLAGLATDEHTAPQDGKIVYETEQGQRVDIRVSIVATTNGEKIVMRLLVSEQQAFGLELLGLTGDDLATVEKEKGRSWGMVLVTGPTGSGKTTTLYALLRKINSVKLNIATIEDPVEYDLPGTNQIQVNEKADITFSGGLRSIVRQDPDVILVGEIRDGETAKIATNAAMTGHLVLSTLHTNNAATAIPRLIDMGIEPFLISSTVTTIVAQRLVRKICPRCREGADIDLKDYAGTIPSDILRSLSKGKRKIRAYKGNGCKLCNDGYHGRTGIFEVIRVSDAIRKLIAESADADQIEKAAAKESMRSMLLDGFEKAKEGITTIDEVLRVVRA